MKRNLWTLIVAVLVLPVFAACMPRDNECCPDPNKTITGAVLQGSDRQGGKGCTPPPHPFKDSDLVGTWVARPGTATDTLILKADYTYQQIYDDKITGDHFESPWQKWSLEYRGNGLPYLHLQGMRKCDDITELCRRVGGGGGSFLWYDFCESRVVKMPDEVILIVLGVPEGRKSKATWTIELLHLMADPDTSPTYFVPQQ